ncbi:unnamed protein product [Penicillium nalgiovense]|nr:unnamed protein product [Penicillium nalgiovense]
MATYNLALEAAALQALSGGVGIPNLYWFGIAYGRKTMVTELPGQSLEMVFNQCGRQFEMHVLIEFACQMIYRLEWMHTRHISHGNLTPSSFMVGLAQWQTPQITVGSFETADLSAYSARNDLEAVGNVLLYFATGSASWDQFKACEQDFKQVPPLLDFYFNAIPSGEVNPADYAKIRFNLHAARRSLSKRSLLGELKPTPHTSLSLKQLFGKTTGDLFECLGVKMSSVGQAAGAETSPWTQEQATSILGALDEIMTIFMVLLMRDKPSPIRRRYLMGAYHLPNRLWRDLRWYLCMPSCGSISFRRLITLRVYKYMGVLLEVVPLYNRYWTKFLSELAYAQMGLDLESSSLWRQAWIYWKNCANHLKKGG